MLSYLRSSALLVMLTLSTAAIAQEGDIAPTAQASAPAAIATPAVQVAPTPVASAAVDAKVGVPPAGKGQIVFFREKKFAGSAVRYKVREGEAELGKLSSGVYFVHVAEPGTHQYIVHSEAKDVLTLEVEPGETYYVQGTITMGFMVGHPNLSPSDQATFERMSAKLQHAE
jgi:hypothetical protein